MGFEDGAFREGELLSAQDKGKYDGVISVSDCGFVDLHANCGGLDWGVAAGGVGGEDLDAGWEGRDEDSGVDCADEMLGDAG